MDVNCPIHKNSQCVKAKHSFPAKKIIQLYKTYYNIDIEPIFGTSQHILQYTCTKTKYRFFYPYTLKGDQLFYEHLSKVTNYYIPWKWENEQALKWIPQGKSVLEIASGNGFFLKEAAKKASFCIGMDIRTESSNQNNITILKQDYRSFFEHNDTTFDVIVSFQFLEHIYDIHDFFFQVSKALNPKGRLILAVPDNNTLIVKKEEVLNFPPHHMGWWTKKSLKKTGEFFGFKTIFAKTEPLQPYLVNRRIYIKEIQRIKNFGFLGKLWNKLTHRFFVFLYTNFLTLSKGHSFIIIMEKK